MTEKTITLTVRERLDGRFDYTCVGPDDDRRGSGTGCTAHDVGEAVAWAVGGFGLPERPERAFARMVSDLDRCEHGRHEGDVCDGCDGASVGNLIVGEPVGFTMGGDRYVMPPRGQRHDPAAWVQR